MVFWNSSAGLLAEGDLVSLSAGLRVEGGKLTDSVNGAGHQLMAPADRALMLVAMPADAGVWLTHMRALGMSQQQASQIISFLNRIGALRISRPLSAKLSVLGGHVALLINGTRPILLTRRLPLSVFGLAIGATLALAPVFAASIVVMLLLYGAGIGNGWLETIATTGGFALWAGVFAHEAGHAIVLRYAGAEGAVLQQGMRLGIIHGLLERKLGIACALAGPAAGLIISVLALGWAAIITGRHELWALAAIMGAFHLLSLLPASADGQTLRRHWGKRGTQ
jgi:hypothetical protein